MSAPRLEHDPRCTAWRSTDPAQCSCRGDDGHAPAESWISGPILGFDIESTGIDPLTARIVTATVVDIQPGAKPVITNWLSDVDGEDIPAGAAEVHGITTEHARTHGRPHRDVVGEIATALQRAWSAGAVVVGHNLGSYDLPLLAAETTRMGWGDFDFGPIADSLVLDRGVDRWRKGKRTLTAAAAVYGVALSEDDAHSSDADALASVRIAWKIARRYPEVGKLTPAALQDWQRSVYVAWAENFGQYLVKQGKVDDVCKTWPGRSSA